MKKAIILTLTMFTLLTTSNKIALGQTPKFYCNRPSDVFIKRLDSLNIICEGDKSNLSRVTKRYMSLYTYDAFGHQKSEIQLHELIDTSRFILIFLGDKEKTYKVVGFWLHGRKFTRWEGEPDLQLLEAYRPRISLFLDEFEKPSTPSIKNF